MTTTCIKGCLILAMLTTARLSWAQDNVSPPATTAQPALRRVFIVRFQEGKTEDATPGFSSNSVNPHDIAQLTASLIRLRLQEIPTLEVKTVRKSPDCGVQANQTRKGASEAVKAPMQTQVSAQDQDRPAVVTEPAGPFLVIRGSLEVHPEISPPSITLDYSLES